MSVPYRTANYSDYLGQISALIGVDQADLQTTELAFLNQFFNRAIRKIWESQNWIDICPFGEVRFPTNLITYPNDFSQTANWTATNVTIVGNNLANPLDARVTASSMLETTANGAHSVSQNVTFLPNQPYSITGYVRPNGRQYIYVAVNDGVSSYTQFFNLNQPTPTTGTSGGTGTFQANIQQCASGFLKWGMTLNSSNTANNGSVAITLSTDGATTSYVGSATAGVYLWGTTAFQTQNVLPASFIIPWSQTGETAIETVFSVWNNDPAGFFIPGRTNYTLKPEGIELIGPSNGGAVWTFYRPQRPLFVGNAWASGSTYSVGQTVQFTSTAALTSGNTNYYTCSVATSANQSPDNTPASWSIINLPYVMLEYCVYNAYADWLQTEGQAAKAVAMYAYAQTCLDDENDKQERQNGHIMPWRVSTHVTSQNRGMGYQGQIFSPSGSYFVN